MAKAIQLLQPVLEWPAGAVVVVEDRRAERLIATGYARAHVLEETPPRLVRPSRRGRQATDTEKD